MVWLVDGHALVSACQVLLRRPQYWDKHALYCAPLPRSSLTTLLLSFTLSKVDCGSGILVLAGGLNSEMFGNVTLTVWARRKDGHLETWQRGTRSEVDNFDNCLRIVSPTPSNASGGIDVLKSRHWRLLKVRHHTRRCKLWYQLLYFVEHSRFMWWTWHIADLWTKPIGFSYKPSCRQPVNYSHHRHFNGIYYYSAVNQMIEKKLQFITLLTAICIVSHIENSKNDKECQCTA